VLWLEVEAMLISVKNPVKSLSIQNQQIVQPSPKACFTYLKKKSIFSVQQLVDTVSKFHRIFVKNIDSEQKSISI